VADPKEAIRDVLLPSNRENNNEFESDNEEIQPASNKYQAERDNYVQ
jgi:hypothetical protein